MVNCYLTKVVLNLSRICLSGSFFSMVTSSEASFAILFIAAFTISCIFAEAATWPTIKFWRSSVTFRWLFLQLFPSDVTTPIITTSLTKWKKILIFLYLGNQNCHTIILATNMSFTLLLKLSMRSGLSSCTTLQWGSIKHLTIFLFSQWISLSFITGDSTLCCTFSFQEQVQLDPILQPFTSLPSIMSSSKVRKPTIILDGGTFQIWILAITLNITIFPLVLGGTYAKLDKLLQNTTSIYLTTLTTGKCWRTSWLTRTSTYIIERFVSPKNQNDLPMLIILNNQLFLFYLSLISSSFKSLGILYAL